MKTTLKKAWAMAKPVTLTVTAYILLPICIAAFAGSAGIVMVAALDLWADLYFVDGVPVASILVATLSLSGLWLLRSPGKKALRSQFTSSLTQAKATLLSLNLGRFTRAITGALNVARQFPTGTRSTRTSYIEPDRVRTVTNRKEMEASSLVHSVVWGNPISRSFEMNCPVNLEANNNYDASK